MTDEQDDELSLLEKHKLVGRMDNLNIGDYDRDFLHELWELDLPSSLDIHQRRRRALRIIYTRMFLDVFGDEEWVMDEEEEEKGKPTLWHMACTCMSIAFFRGYAYGKKGGEL